MIINANICIILIKWAPLSQLKMHDIIKSSANNVALFLFHITICSEKYSSGIVYTFQ